MFFEEFKYFTDPGTLILLVNCAGRKVYYLLFSVLSVLQKIIVTDTPSDKVSIKTRPTQQSQECTWMQLLKGHFPPGGIFREERHFEDQLAESGRQKTKESIIPCGKFRQEENDLNSLK